MKKAARLYEVSFFSELWMVFPESWKRSCPNFYAHDCTIIKNDHNEPTLINNVLFLNLPQEFLLQQHKIAHRPHQFE